MIRPIKLTDDSGKEYVLEFDRESVKWAESRGFIIGDVEKFPLTKVYELFWYAFRKNHKNVSKAETDAMLDELGGVTNLPEGLLERLAELYVAPFSTLAEGEERKNAIKVEL